MVDEKSIVLITISRKRCRQSISSIGIAVEVGMAKYPRVDIQRAPVSDAVGRFIPSILGFNDASMCTYTYHIINIRDDSSKSVK